MSHIQTPKVLSLRKLHKEYVSQVIRQDTAVVQVQMASPPDNTGRTVCYYGVGKANFPSD
jgi:hypothetical protein